MWDKVILKNGGILMFIPACYKDQNMCSKAVDSYVHVLGSVPDFFKTQKVCVKEVSIYLSTTYFVPDWSRTQE